MTVAETAELAALKKRFPHIQGIRADSMDLAMAAGILQAAGAHLLYSCYPLDLGTDVLQMAGGLISLVVGTSLLLTAWEEGGAIDRYFSLLKRAKRAFNEIPIVTIVRN